MITLLHGDNIEASRAELTSLKLQAHGREIRELDGQKVDGNMLVQSIESSSMFGDAPLVIIERLFSRLGRQQKRIEQLCTVLTGTSGDIVLWEDKEVGTTVIKNLGTPTIRLFKLPVLIFQFLDGLRPNNAKQLLTIFGRLESSELAFALLVKRVRQLIAIADGAAPVGLQGWQVSRLTTQSKSFTIGELVSLYKALGEIEYGVKSGTYAFTMKQLLEQAFIGMLK